jgi:hypothetical protein
VSSRSFFAFSLLLPAIGAVLGQLVSKLGFLVFLFWGGLVPYFPLAIILATLVLKTTSFRNLLVLSAAAPIAYGVMFAVFIGIIGYAPAMHFSARQYGEQFLSAAGTGGWIACCYVGVSWILWLAGRKMGWVVNEFAT